MASWLRNGLEILELQAAKPYVPGSINKPLLLGMVNSSHLKHRESLYVGILNSYYKVDDHPNHRKQMGVLDSSTYDTNPKKALLLMIQKSGCSNHLGCIKTL